LAYRALNTVQRIAPIKPLTYAHARLFSTSNIQTDSSSESDVEAGEQKTGRFFKFLEKAESLDKKLEKNPEIAKQVGDIEEVKQEMEIMFDIDEIEISFAD